jgi:hypothetical protein
MKLLTLSLASAVALLPLAALAAPAADEATAQKLTAELQQDAERFISSFPGLKLEGEVSIRPEGDSYALSLPPLSFTLKNGELIRTAAMTGRLTPQDNQEYRYTLNMPNPVATMFDITQVPAYVLTTTAQDMTGVWSEKHDAFLNGILSMRGVRVSEAENSNVVATLDQLRVENDISISPANRMDGKVLLSLSALAMYNKQQTQVLSLAGAGVSYLLKDVNYTAFRAMQDRARAEQSGAPSGKEISGMLADLGQIGGSSAIAFVGRDLIAREVRSGGPGSPASTVKLPLLRVMLDSSSHEGGLTNGGLRYQHEGLAITPPPGAAIAELLPARLELAGQLERFPVQQVFALLNETSSSGQRLNAMQDMWTRALLELESARTTLTVSQLGYAAPRLTSSTSGQFAASAAARFGATGELNTRINGLDEVLAHFKSLLSPPADGGVQAQPDPSIQSVMMGLTMLQTFGQIVKDASPSARTYKLELGADGSLKLNGTDFSTMMGMAGGMAGGMPPALPGDSENPVRE